MLHPYIEQNINPILAAIFSSFTFFFSLLFIFTNPRNPVLFVHRSMIYLACLVLPCEGTSRMINLVLSHVVLPSLRQQSKGLFGKNGTVPLGDRFCCENDLLSVLKRKEKGHLYGETERNHCTQTGPNSNHLHHL